MSREMTTEDRVCEILNIGKMSGDIGSMCVRNGYAVLPEVRPLLTFESAQTFSLDTLIAIGAFVEELAVSHGVETRRHIPRRNGLFRSFTETGVYNSTDLLEAIGSIARTVDAEITRRSALTRAL